MPGQVGAGTKAGFFLQFLKSVDLPRFDGHDARQIQGFRRTQRSALPPNEPGLPKWRRRRTGSNYGDAAAVAKFGGRARAARGRT